jgi:phosphate-selective porin OprO/OprP
MASLLLGSSLAVMTVPALAQTAEPAPEAEVVAEETTDAAAQAEFLQAQVEALQAQINELKAAMTKATPQFKGAPQFTDKDAGWSFKLRGRLMYDIGYVENPDDAINTKNLGFNSRVRRARVGVEGEMPGSFQYKMEVDFADNTVSWADAFVEYKPKGVFSARVGHFETFQSLEQITSSRHIMFLERAQMNEAFNHGRRLGGAIGIDSGDFLLRAGVFNDTINNTYDNDELLFGARAVYAPKMGNNQLHFGVNYQHREFTTTALNFRYRMRNPNRLTDVRLVDTNAFAASSDDVVGLEAAGIFGSLHLAGEAQWVSANAYAPGHKFSGGDVAGTTNFASGDPSFFSYYFEAGYWLTGETRGYKKGEWDRTKVKNGFDKGGWGALAITGRYDYLDLSDSDIQSGGIGTNTSRGGKQSLYQLSLVWQPIDYIRITTAYAHADIEGGPFASAVKSDSTEPVNERSYGQDSIAVRFAFDY